MGFSHAVLLHRFVVCSLAVVFPWYIAVKTVQAETPERLLSQSENRGERFPANFDSCLEFPCVLSSPGGNLVLNGGVTELTDRSLSFVVTVAKAGHPAATVSVLLSESSPRVGAQPGSMRFLAHVDRFLINPWGLPHEKVLVNEAVPYAWDASQQWHPSTIGPPAMSVIAMTLAANATGKTPEFATRALCTDTSFGGLGCDGPTSFPLGIPLSASPEIVRCCIAHDIAVRGGPPVTGGRIVALNAEFAACLSTAGLAGALAAPINVAASTTIAALQYFFGIGSSHGANAGCYCSWDSIPEDLMEAILDPNNGQGKNTIYESECCDETKTKCLPDKECTISVTTTDLDLYTDTVHKFKGVCKKGE